MTTKERVDGCCIYGLKDPRKPWRVCYVGATINIVQRTSSYLGYYDKGFGHSAMLTDWFRELRKAGVVPEVEVLEYCQESELSVLEQVWIALMRQFFPLLNCDAKARRYQIKGQVGTQRKRN